MGLVAAAGVAAVGTIAGGAIASGGAKSAAKSAQQSADQSMQFQRQTQDQNIQALAPWQQSGLAANNQINALLGLGGGQTAQQQVQPAPWMGSGYGGGGGGFNDYSQIGDSGILGNFSNFNGGSYGGGYGTANALQQTGPDAANAAFDQFRNYTGYQFRLGQGMDAINSGYAGRGAVKSGAAMKAINDYGQGMASAEFGNYMGYLGNQANTGLSATNAQAGVATNAANNMSNIAMQNGSNQANAALMRAQNSGQMLNQLGTIGSGLVGQMGGGGGNAPNYSSALSGVTSQLQGTYNPLPRF